MVLITDLDAERLRLAYEVAINSPDPSTQNGALAYSATGVLIGQASNTLTYGMARSAELFMRPKKYHYVEHAERGALYDVLRNGRGPVHTIVCPWAACADCARALVQSGVHRLVRHDRQNDEQWSDSIAAGNAIMVAGGVEIVEHHGELRGCAPIRVKGLLWRP
jgi:deoxycytidylate deaminase